MAETTTKAMEEFRQSADVDLKNTQVATLNYKEAFLSYPEDQRKEIQALADAINVTEMDKVMAYGSNPLLATFDQCGKILKNEEGTSADQQVVQMVISLSKEANEQYEDFNLALKEPNFIEKILLRISSKRSEKKMKDLQVKAATSYRLLKQLKESCDNWLDILKKSMFNTTSAKVDDVLIGELLEKYLVAGYMAMERLEQEISVKKEAFEKTGLQAAEDEYNTLKEGWGVLQIVLINLERSRVMYRLSVGQLSAIERTNRNLQISINTQSNNSMALMAQQLRNAILDAQNGEILRGYREITQLNNGLMKKVSANVAKNVKDSEELIYSGFYSLSAAKEATQYIIKSCQEIEQVGSEMLPKIQAELKEAHQLMDELTPYINQLRTRMSVESGKTSSSSSKPAPTTELKF